jgi:hypothetical protein
MQPCLSIPTDVGDVVLRQPLMVLSGYGSGSTAAYPPCHGARTKFGEPISRIGDAHSERAYATHRRARAGRRLAQTQARRLAIAAKRDPNTFFGCSTTGELGRSSTTLFPRRHPFRRGPCSLEARGTYSVRTVLCASLCQRQIRSCILSSMDKCRSTQQCGPFCVRSTHD